jgi:hypothetical protein
VNEAQDSTVEFPGFREAVSHHVVDQIIESLKLGERHNCIHIAAEHFGCSYREVVILWRDLGTRGGRYDVPVVFFKQALYGEFVKVLHQTRTAYYHNYQHIWTIENDGEAFQYVAARLSDFFRVLVDFDAATLRLHASPYYEALAVELSPQTACVRDLSVHD